MLRKIINKIREKLIGKKRPIIKYTAIVITVAILAISIFFIANPEKGFSIFKGSEKNNGETSQAQTEAPPTCTDEIQNQGEAGVDCGGPCDACPPSCSDGILNQDETKADCGGTICPACPTCTDGIQNQGERHIDCGGPCNACPPDCSDGILNQDETSIDCGGTICPACVIAPTIVTALTADEVAKVKNAILSSQFIKDMPKNGVVSLHFFNYQNGQRIELDTFLIGKDQILTSGTPDISVIIHSKYIAELTPTNLCEIIPKANANGDMAVGTTDGEAKLLLKYSGMVKYRSCFGF